MPHKDSLCIIFDYSLGHSETKRLTYRQKVSLLSQTFEAFRQLEKAYRQIAQTFQSIGIYLR